MQEPLSKRQIREFARIFFCDDDEIADAHISLIKELIEKEYLNEKKVFEALIIEDYLRFRKGNIISNMAIYRRLSQDYPYTPLTIRDIVLRNSHCM